MKHQIKSLLAVLTLALSSTSQALEADQVLVRCDDGYSHGFELELAGDSEGFTRAELSLNDFVDPSVVATMICRSHEIDHTITDGPWVVASCNNMSWNDRYNVDYVVSGFTPAQAVVRHNEQELVTLTCREAQ